MELLGRSFAQLPQPLRLVLVKSLILLHNRGRITSLQAVPFFLKLFRHHDKTVRRLLFQHILAGEPSPLADLSCVDQESVKCVLVKTLVLLHIRGRITSLQAVPFFLKLFRHHDKTMRRLLFQHILAGELCFPVLELISIVSSPW